jgi:hypothetical protein
VGGPAVSPDSRFDPACDAAHALDLDPMACPFGPTRVCSFRRLAATMCHRNAPSLEQAVGKCTSRVGMGRLAVRSINRWLYAGR